MPAPMPQPPAGLGHEERRRRLRETLTILAAGAAVVAFAVWEISSPTGHDTTGNVLSFLLVNLNIILLLVVAFLVVRNVIKLVVERRRRVPGSHLRSRLVLAFVAIALFPVGVMLMFSFQFVTTSIDDWLSRDVEEALEGAWEVAHVYYRHTADQAFIHSQALADEISRGDLMDSGARDRLTALVADRQLGYKLGTVQVIDASGRQLIARFNESIPTGVPLFPDPELLVETRAGRGATKVEKLGEADVLRGAAPILTSDGTVMGAVIVDYFVEESASRSTENILSSFREFRQLRLNKQPFKNLYAITLALASLVVLLSATWLGIYMARGITDPLASLAQATHEIAEGRWDVEIEDVGGDEIGTLVTAFNSMTAQLKLSHRVLDERRTYIESVLANIDAGVVSVGLEGQIEAANPAAISLLGLPDSGVEGAAATEVLGRAGYAEIVTLLVGLTEGRAASGARINVKREDEGRTVQITGANLVRAGGDRAGIVLFVQNVSQIVEVQRMEAWREVARRIAHEIKNPLTPIQLSAQRLGRRLRNRLEADDARVAEECVGTIVGEVDRLKALVNEFSNFARQSEGPKTNHDLNQIVEETMPLFRQARPDIAMRFDAAADLPELALNRDSVKRALVNLLDNAVAAVSGEEAKVEGVPMSIEVVTRRDDELSRVVLEVCDSGPGVPEQQRGRVFEPYFSTKSDGTGLGLAIVASVAADHRAYIRVRDNKPRGARFVIEFPMSSPDQGSEGRDAFSQEAKAGRGRRTKTVAVDSGGGASAPDRSDHISSNEVVAALEASTDDGGES